MQWGEQSGAEDSRGGGHTLRRNKDLAPGPTEKAQGQEGQTGFHEILPEAFCLYVT